MRVNLGVSLMGDQTINLESEEVEFLIKLGSHEYMKSLFEDGEIYMNTLECYRTLEADDERRDVNEGVERIQNRKGGVLRRKNPETGIHEEIAQLTHSRIRHLNSNLQNLNVYCLYYLKAKVPIKSLGELIAERTKIGFGEYAVIVVNAAEFLTRIKQVAIDNEYQHFRGLVKYTDFSVDDFEVGPFVKDQSFSHQRELRVAVSTGEDRGSAIRLYIGSLNDIAVMVPVAELNKISIHEQG